MRTRLLYVVVAAALAQGCAPAPAAEAPKNAGAALLNTAVHELTSVIIYDIFSPPQASRVYAYASVAAYEALRQNRPEFRSMAGQLNGLTPVPSIEAGKDYHLPLAAVEAFMTVATAMTFSHARMDSARALLRRQVRNERISNDVFDRSVAYGASVGQHVLKWSQGDRYAQTRGMPKYTVTSALGRWIPTPPAYMDAVEPNWGKIRPFVLDSANQFPAQPPLRFDTTKGSPFYVQMREVFTTGRQLSQEQRAIAAFWDCNPYVMHVQGHAMFATKKVTPGGHWMGIVGIASRKVGADAVETAEAYARTAIALADGFITSWDTKYKTNLVRPETVINKYLDESWEPLLQTPPFPEYTSAHSVISTAAAVVLSKQFGDAFAFADSTEVDFGLPVRSFQSFTQAASEAAISRLYGGIHYRRAIEQGILQGRHVGERVIQKVRTRAE